ncbi:MAG: pseudouridine synthase [Alphaproteobacteria bacterium]|nr:pseudouridine synthase [Alphaproteobacteria bacterium]
MERLALNDRVLFDGEPIEDVAARIVISPDLPARMSVDGEPLDPPPGLILALHKPLGVTCSHKEAGPLVYDLLPPRWRRRDPAISTVGRLDKETSGLLLMTDDGALLHRIIAPKSHVAKRYRVDLARPLRGDEAALFGAGGLMLESDDKPLLPAEFEPLSDRAGLLTLHEGRYHQVRRMFAAIGNHVDALHRDRIGGFTLPDDLAPGQLRVLGAAEVGAIFALES